MESSQFQARRVLPFDINKNQSIKEINKNFKVMANSSAAYNLYMNKFYQSPKHVYEPNLKSNFFKEIKPDRSNSNSSAHNLTNKQRISIDNQSYLDDKFKLMCDSINSNQILRGSKIKGNFTHTKYRNEIELKSSRTEACYLPQLTEALGKTSPMPLIASNVMIDNILDCFFETKIKGSGYNKSEINYVHLKMNTKILEEKVIQTIRNINEGGEINKSALKFKKVFNSNLKSEMKLCIKPFVIEFIDLKLKENENSIKFNFPFELIPLLYLCDSKETIEFLFYALKLNTNDVNKENSDSSCNYISINENNLLLALTKMKIFKNIIFNSEDENEKGDFNQNTPPNKFITSRLQDEKIKEVINFNWISKNFNYDITVHLPVIELKIVRKNLLIKKIIDKDFLLLLIYNKFENWELFTINYLVLMKSFRTLFNKLSTKTNYNLSYDNERKIISLDEFGTVILKSQTFEDNNFIFIYSNTTENNYLIKINTYCVECNKIGFYQENVEKNIFNFKHSIIINKLSYLWKIEILLRKVFSFNKLTKKIDIDTKILDKFDDDFIIYTQKYNLHKIDPPNSANYELNLNVEDPSVEWLTVDENKLKINSESLEPVYLRSLFMVKDIHDWKKFLFLNAEKFVTKQINIKNSSPNSSKRMSVIASRPSFFGQPKITEMARNKSILVFENTNNTNISPNRNLATKAVSKY